MPLQRSWPLAVLACAACSASPPPGGAPDLSPEPGPPDLAPPADAAQAPAIELVGRFDHADPAGPRFEWPGSTIRLRFSGTSLTLRLRDSSAPGSANTYSVVIDGAAPAELTADSATQTHLLASNLAPGPHQATIVRNTESFVGTAQLLGFDYGPSGALLAPTPLGRRIELIGDSITCGYGDTGADQTCNYSAATEDEYLAYGALAAHALSADATAIAWSGKGVYRNNDNSMTETMPVLWRRTLPQDPSSVWDFATRAPDAVVIDLGTNDFAKGTPDATGFTDAYRALVVDVRAHYPAAHIFCALGPMLSDDYPQGAQNLTTARGWISGVVSALAQAGDARVHFLEFPVQNPMNGYGCDYHPSLKTHELMAAQLQAALSSALGW